VEKIWLSSPHIGEKEKEYVAEAFATNWIAPLGPQVDRFEEELSALLGVKSTAVLNSGTAALHLALEISGIRENDVVLCQSFTFAASAFPILYQKAVPVFIDSEPETWNMDPELLEQAIRDLIGKGKRPAAIIVVHLYGMPANMDKILAVAGQYSIPVIEDAAEALGSRYHDKPCGSMGDLSILSFNGNKIITTSGGGALCSNDENLISKARFYATQSREPVPYYLHKEVGYNYRMSNVLAAIGRGQLEVLGSRVEKRRQIFEKYSTCLGSIRGVRFPKEPEGLFSNRWLTTMLFDSGVWGIDMNERIREGLEAENVESRHLWKPLHQQPVFDTYQRYLNGVSDDLFQRGLCLPSGSNLTEAQQDHVIDLIVKLTNEVR
jgi:dTDP-4-amino-4,6-dideoxygalactose transaminase